MLPTPGQLRGFTEGTEDGSRSVRFADVDGGALELFFPVLLDGTADPTPRYSSPELRREVPHQYTNRFSGGNLDYRTREDTPLTWDDATRLLDALVALDAPGVPNAPEHLAELRAIARAGGHTAPPPRTRNP
jgi:hypothetical protein